MHPASPSAAEAAADYARFVPQPAAAAFGADAMISRDSDRDRGNATRPA
jgi:hypothetical protein